MIRLLAMLFLLLPFTATAEEALTATAEEALEVFADTALEWRRDDGAYVARGNAVAVQGDLRVRADVLVAYAAQGAEISGGGQLDRLVAEGGVEIRLPDATAYGDRGDYRIGEGLIVLRGGALRLETSDTVITARDSLEYRPDERLLIARGAARAVRGDDRIDADILSARLAEDANGDPGALESLQAQGSVVISMQGPDGTDIVRGDRARYRLADETATVEGNVSIRRGNDVLTGGAAQVDLDAGVGRLYTPDTAPQERVRAIFRVGR